MVAADTRDIFVTRARRPCPNCGKWVVVIDSPLLVARYFDGNSDAIYCVCMTCRRARSIESRGYEE